MKINIKTNKYRTTYNDIAQCDFVLDGLYKYSYLLTYLLTIKQTKHQMSLNASVHRDVCLFPCNVLLRVLRCDVS